jgi:hypothetical protein
MLNTNSSTVFQASDYNIIYVKIEEIFNEIKIKYGAYCSIIDNFR